MNKLIRIAGVFMFCMLSVSYAFEVVDEGEGSEEPVVSNENQSTKKVNQTKRPEEASDLQEYISLLSEEERPIHMTSEKYRELYEQNAFSTIEEPWVFLFFHGAQEYWDSNLKILGWLKDLQTEKDILGYLWQSDNGQVEIKSVRVAYINLIDEGELLKETFDVKKSPRFVLIKNNIQIPYVVKDGRLSYNELVDMIKLKHNLPKQPRLEIRPLVEENRLVYEYACTAIGEWFMENDGPKHMNMLKEDYGLDVTQLNENFGKKQWVKAQGRTVAQILAVLIAVLVLNLLIFCCCCCKFCCRGGSSQEKLKVKIQ